MKSLDELQALNLPRCDWRALLTVTKGEMSPEDTASLDAHFQHFVAPGPCIKCGAQQGGDVMDAVLGKAKFQWAITHGEGNCSVKGCGYPARALHYDIGPIKKLPLILQYHPSELHERQEAAS